VIDGALDEDRNVQRRFRPPFDIRPPVPVRLRGSSSSRENDRISLLFSSVRKPRGAS
jgi:hypothetical protein